MPRMMTVADYCASLPNGCPDEPSDCEFGVMRSVERGCGFVKYVYEGDVSDHWTAVYDSRTGKVVHYTHNGMYSSFCASPLIVGTMPECETWSVKSCPFGEGDGGTD